MCAEKNILTKFKKKYLHTCKHKCLHKIKNI